MVSKLSCSVVVTEVHSHVARHHLYLFQPKKPTTTDVTIALKLYEH